jgi:hypothetical protein
MFVPGIGKNTTYDDFSHFSKQTQRDGRFVLECGETGDGLYRPRHNSPPHQLPLGRFTFNFYYKVLISNVSFVPCEINVAMQ